jgi:hypothetical protein
MVKIKIAGGTAVGGEDLCQTCRHAMKRRDVHGKSTIKCEVFNTFWKFPTSECNAYSDQRQPSILEMAQSAWIVSTDPKQKAGFKPRAHPVEEHPDVIEIPLDEKL